MMGKPWHFLRIFKYKTTIQLINPTPRYLSREMKTCPHRLAHHTLTEALFIIAKNGNNLNVYQLVNRLLKISIAI